MPTTVTNTADRSIIHQNSFVAEDFNSAGLVEAHNKLVLPYGEGQMSHWYFDGIRMGYSNWKYKRNVETAWHGDLDVVHLHFNLKGKITFDYQNLGKQFVMNSSQHNMFYSNGFEGLVRNEELYSESFMIQLTREAFLRLTADANDQIKEFGERIMKGAPTSLSENNLFIDILMHNAINDVLRCPYNGGMKKMYLLSKCLEIIVLQAESYHRAETAAPRYVKTEYDQERIIFARDYLLQHADMPPGLPELARVAGVNEFKLKKGFKEIFNNTVFGYLADYRLEQAKIEIAHNQKTATEIAFELGYSSLQHFSAAFKKKFGVSPKGRG